MLNKYLFRFAVCLFVLITLPLLNSCSGRHRKDGPPNFYVDESKIPDATPKVEPLSRIGNKPSYVVFGRRYYVMRSSKNYHERGIASWYGTLFHEHHTSNGEKYNMLSMTAAHKTLPLPTYVQVTNLGNGRKIIVKVNDRGPFEANRIIDLSYVAAKKLGMLGHGTARVDLQAIDPSEYYRQKNNYANTSPIRHHHHSPVIHQTEDDNFVPTASVYLQVGAFRDKTKAIRLKNRLVAMLKTPVQITESNHLYHVKVGPIRNTAVNQINKKLKTIGLNGKREFDIA